MAKKKTKAGKPPPRCKAILLCDQTIVDAATGKTSLIGVFEGFTIQGFPGPTIPCAAYIQLVDGIGDYSVTIEIHDLRDDVPLARMPPLRLEFPQRVNKATLLLRVPPFQLPHEGTYDFVVFANGQEIDRQKFQASLPQRPADDTANQPDQ